MMTNDTWPPPGELDKAMAFGHVDALQSRVAKLEAILRVVRRDLAESAAQMGRAESGWDHTSKRESIEHGKDIDRIHELIDAAIPDAYTSSEEYDKARDMLWKREDI